VRVKLAKISYHPKVYFEKRKAKNQAANKKWQAGILFENQYGIFMCSQIPSDKEENSDDDKNVFTG